MKMSSTNLLIVTIVIILLQIALIILTLSYMICEKCNIVLGCLFCAIFLYISIMYSNTAIKLYKLVKDAKRKKQEAIEERERQKDYYDTQRIIDISCTDCSNNTHN